MTRDTIHTKVGKNFHKELKELKAMRRLDVDSDLDREISMAKLTDGIVNLPEWENIKKRLTKEPRKEQLRGMF